MDRTLHTPRLCLRPPRAADAPWAFARWAGRAEVATHLGWGPHTNERQTRDQLAWDESRWHKRSAWTWLLCPTGQDTPVGQVQLLPQRLEGPAHHLRAGYVLSPEWQGQGLMHEALAALGDHALSQPEVWRLDALVVVANERSARLLAALAWQREGRLACVLPGRDPQQPPSDAWLWARTRPTVPSG